MGKPDKHFYRSTIREILSRWDVYAQAKGYKGKTEIVEEYDSEGI